MQYILNCKCGSLLIQCKSYLRMAASAAGKQRITEYKSAPNNFRSAKKMFAVNYKAAISKSLKNFGQKVN